MSECKLQLQSQGKATPRTCPTCGISGHCARGYNVAIPPRDPDDETKRLMRETAERVAAENARVRRNPTIFPEFHAVNDVQMSNGGMTLHDYYVGQAIVGLLQYPDRPFYKADKSRMSLYEASNYVADELLDERLRRMDAEK